MAKILAVHGTRQELKGEHTLKAEWLPALRDGLRRTNIDLPNDNDLACVFYGDVFRKKGTKALYDPVYDASDLDEWEAEMILALWREAAAIDEQVPHPDSHTKGRWSQITQRALNALSQSKFFAGLTERVLIGSLKQVWTYLRDQELRKEVCGRVARYVTPETKVLIGHSLGSIVAYETLCAHSEWKVHAFVTLGSPLGIRNLIFEKLKPCPRGGRGVWPAAVQQWTNIADAGDIYALVKRLGPLFGAKIEDQLVHNGATAHRVTSYLTAEETGRAIAFGLAD